MVETFIDAKARSKKNFSWWSAPLIGSVLLLIGETLGVIGFFWLSDVANDSYINLLGELFAFATISLAVILWARIVEKAPWQGLGLQKENAFKEFVKGWGIGAALLVSCVLIMMAFGAVKIESIDFSGRLWLKFIPLVLAWSVQGTTEEVLCRGWLFSSISSKNNLPIGIFVSSLFFMAIHLGNDAISIIPLLDLFMFAVLACLIMLKTNNLWVVSGLHAAWNCFQGNAFAFPVSGTETGEAFIRVSTHGPGWLSGAAFGVEGSIVSVLVQTSVILWLCYDLFWKSKK